MRQRGRVGRAYCSHRKVARGDCGRAPHNPQVHGAAVVGVPDIPDANSKAEGARSCGGSRDHAATTERQSRRQTPSHSPRVRREATAGFDLRRISHSHRRIGQRRGGADRDCERLYVDPQISLVDAARAILHLDGEPVGACRGGKAEQDAELGKIDTGRQASGSQRPLVGRRSAGSIQVSQVGNADASVGQGTGGYPQILPVSRGSGCGEQRQARQKDSHCVAPGRINTRGASRSASKMQDPPRLVSRRAGWSRLG